MSAIHPLPIAFFGGGSRSLIGAAHRGAAALSGRFFVCGGVFGTDVGRERAYASSVGIDPTRVHADIGEWIHAEAIRPESDRARAVAVLTPNHLHHPMVARLLDAGFHVMCEKPFTVDVAQAEDLLARANAANRVISIAHTYTGYPMVRQMRVMIASGAIGQVQKIDASYYQGWINPAMHEPSRRPAIWRLDPARSGPSGCFSDIGIHAFDLVEYTTGLRVQQVLAELDAFRPGNALDVDGTVLLRTQCGVRGLIRASQIATGEENAVGIAVYGSRGALKWTHERPCELVHLREDGPMQVFTPGHAFNAALAREASQLPPGHPQGMVEAIANLYRGFADEIARVAGAPDHHRGGAAGLRGMRFLSAVLASERGGQVWVEIPA